MLGTCLDVISCYMTILYDTVTFFKFCQSHNHFVSYFLCTSVTSFSLIKNKECNIRTNGLYMNRLIILFNLYKQISDCWIICGRCHDNLKWFQTDEQLSCSHAHFCKILNNSTNNMKGAFYPSFRKMCNWAHFRIILVGTFP